MSVLLACVSMDHMCAWSLVASRRHCIPRSWRCEFCCWCWESSLGFLEVWPVSFLPEPSSSLNPFALASECWVLGMYHADHFICVWCFCGFEPRALHMQTSSHLTYTLGRILVSLSFLFFCWNWDQSGLQFTLLLLPSAGTKGMCHTPALVFCLSWNLTTLPVSKRCLLVCFYFLIPGQWTKSREIVF